jgi:hypothetical protein
MWTRNAMKINRFRKIGICLVVVALSYVLSNEFMPELLALTWHLRHGKVAHLKSWDGKKYGVEVPASWWAQVDDGGWEVSLIKKPGGLRRLFQRQEWALISVSLGPTSSTAQVLRNSAPVLKEKSGITTTEGATVALAGQETYCFEQNWATRKVAETTLGLPAAVDLTCVSSSDVRGFSAS